MNTTKPKSFRQWVEVYEEKTGERVELPQGFSFAYMATRGFMIYMVCKEDNMLIVHQVCGDGHFWHDAAELMAREKEVSTIGTKCIVPIKPYLRNFGCDILMEFEKEGVYRYICQDGLGRKVVATQITKADGNAEPNFFVTHYLNERPVLGGNKTDA